MHINRAINNLEYIYVNFETCQRQQFPGTIEEYGFHHGEVGKANPLTFMLILKFVFATLP